MPPEPIPARPTPGDATRAASYSLLIVEDNDDHFELIGSFARRTQSLQLSITRERTLADGIAACGRDRYEVVLLDLSLPDSDVGETLPRFLAAVSGPAVIVLTSLDDADLGAELVAAGAQDYLTKLNLDRRQLERAIRYSVQRKQTLQQLRETNEGLRAFAHTVAHEVRTPAAVALMALDGLKLEGLLKADAMAAKYVEMARSALTGLNDLTAELLQFAEMEDRGPAEPVDLDRVADGLTDEFRDDLRRVGGELAFGPLPVVQGRVTQLTVLLRNLIGNAIKYRQDVPLRIRVDSESVDQLKSGQRGYAVVVRDNGRGIAAEHLPRLFDVFYRVDPKSEVAGTGVGLSLCRRIAERNGGELGVESTVGVGTTFRLRLPAAGTAPPA